MRPGNIEGNGDSVRQRNEKADNQDGSPGQRWGSWTRQVKVTRCEA